MKTPADLQLVLRRQWEKPAVREARLLHGASAWPIVISIGRPSARTLRHSLDQVRHHIQSWRQVRIGRVAWEPIQYRATASPVDIPVAWKLDRPSEWIDAAGDSSVRQEFQTLAHLVEQTASQFHSLLVRRRSLWSGKPLQEVVQASRLALTLTPGCVRGQPLRMVSLEGIDTKFFERHSKLITALLDVRFDGEASAMGLESFLGAAREGDHWLLVVDLDGSLLRFRKMRIRAAELQEAGLPGSRLLIVENEACQHQLPNAEETVAVLGAGLDLNWTEAPWVSSKRVAYWGDIDTWGLQLLAKARQSIPHLDSLLMSEAIYDEFDRAAVVEPVVAGTDVPEGLSDSESRLYGRLLCASRGRLEQEFLPPSLVQQRILAWAANH